jgi:ferric-dicitrate binding protein FerR (iron transport regulator)
MVNPESKQQLIELVTKVLNGQATAEEKAFLEKYYDYFDRHGTQPAGLSSSERKALEDKILDHIFLEIDKRDGEKPARIRILKVAGIAAAVAAVVAIAAVIYFQEGRGGSDSVRNGKQIVNHHIQTDIAPGGAKAVLTLANGSQVLLDSARNGSLATQGNIRVVKLGNGQMAYKPAEGYQRAGEQQAATAYNTLSTPRGGSYQLTLPDGSRVWLNSASSLTFPVEFTARERRVTLEGEAYFEVTKNSLRPFIVQTHGLEIKDLGTRFNVMAYQDEPDARTTLVEGAVEVAKGLKNVLLKPGQQAVVGKNTSGRIVVSKADVEEAVAWKAGYFSFHRTSIYEIMRQISRWYDVDVSYQDSVGVSLNGHISRSVNASEVFRTLELTGELTFTIQGKKVIVRETRSNHS